MRINCYNNVDWPDDKKDEIDRAIKRCLEVIFHFSFNHILKISPIFYDQFQKKLDNKNKQLQGVFNSRYRKIKKLGESAQGTVYEVEDLNENQTKYFNIFF